MTAGVVEALTAQRIERARRGAAMCRAAIADVVTRRAAAVRTEALTRSDEIRERAIARAVSERRRVGV